jgi:lipopolysaccharide transport system ATP-binding protein
VDYLPGRHADNHRKDEFLMSDVLVSVENISKKFCRSLKKSLWYGMQDLGSELLGQQHGGNGELRPHEFWAVKDVSFELKRGECLGLIGHNGAGKTTLLRMLNGLIKPDRGRIVMRGRVGAIIALGAGFNPILTGRENIYVNASMLGLSKREIDGKIDEMIDFAEIGEFIDSPVQNYSSGMAVRLGFAVSSAIKPDVVVLDEVLAVGDSYFRAKCYQRISSLLEKSAVILVSHNMDQISQICSSAITMNSGHCVCAGDVGECMQSYNQANVYIPGNAERSEYCSPGGSINSKSFSELVEYGGSLHLHIVLGLSYKVETADVKISIFTSAGQIVAEGYTKASGKSYCLDSGVAGLTLSIGPLYLKEGAYSASVVVLNRHNNEHLYWGSRIFDFKARGPVFGSGSIMLPIDVSITDAIDRLGVTV